MQNRRAARSEGGFAMLFVFLLAACIAISLYAELPRVVFEAQRSREELLIAHGEEYKRAIQLYYRARRMYPPNLEALENTNNRRFLRKRYKDPMTGEEEWRLVHIGPAGILTDSLVTKAPGQEKATDSSTMASVEAPTPLWLQRRPSDGAMPGNLDESASEPQQETALATYAAPASDQPSPAGEPALAQPLAGPDQVTRATTGAGSLAQPSSTGASGNPASDMIYRLLTTPSSSGMTITSEMRAGGGQQIGSAIAGVASKLEAEGIKVYGERTKYNEWEFVYDPRQDRSARIPTGSGLATSPSKDTQTSGSSRQQ
jgi:hypothetical protein